MQFTRPELHGMSVGKPVEAAGAVQERGTPLGERFLEAIGLKTHEPVVEVRHISHCQTQHCIWSGNSLSVIDTAQHAVAASVTLLHSSVSDRDGCSNSLLGLHAQSYIFRVLLVVTIDCTPSSSDCSRESFV